MLHKTCQNILLLLVWGSLLWGAVEPTVSPTPVLPTTTRGQTVTVMGENLPAQGVHVLLQTGKEGKGDKGLAIDAVVATDGKSLSFKLPKDNLDTGRYLVYVAFDSKELPVAGGLTVASAESAQGRVPPIYPATTYGNNKKKAYEVEISGENLAQAPNDNIIEVVGHGPLTVGSAEEC